jgi:hypothetical protein
MASAAPATRPRLVDVFDAQQPLAAVGARVKIAADGGDQRTEVQRARSVRAQNGRDR